MHDFSDIYISLTIRLRVIKENIFESKSNDKWVPQSQSISESNEEEMGKTQSTTEKKS